MANFNEHSLEMSIMELFQDEGYIYLNGEQIHRERSEVLLIDDLRKYLLNRYAADGLTPSEVDSIILRLRSISGTIYEANKAVCKMICDGFIFNREDHTKKDLYIELIDFDEPEKNVFKIINQFEIEGINNQLRIPDGIVFINGIPVVVLEFKSAVKENTTIMDAYTQLTVRYRRDIPELFKYNAFIVISDGANNKYGSFFSPYDFFYAWRKFEADDKELDGINSLVTMVSGLFRKERLLQSSRILSISLIARTRTSKSSAAILSILLRSSCLRISRHISDRRGTARAAHTSARQAAEKAILCSSSQECL